MQLMVVDMDSPKTKHDPSVYLALAVGVCEDGSLKLNKGALDLFEHRIS